MYTRLFKHGTSTYRNRYGQIVTRNCHKNITKSIDNSRVIVSPGNSLHGFLCNSVEHIPEYNMTAYYLSHVTTQTPYLHLEKDDTNNVFSIGFRTTPLDSMGTPHILEHTVLCGSEKFPVRDPFFKMLNRSLATFMNALTGPDYTFYPFSSQNETDYRNLQQVYMDAVFKPNLARLDFLQEGWRLEHTIIDSNSSPLAFKGVVYNEMKGAFSETSSLFGQKFMNAILPNGTYGYVSGGDPLHIPNLTHSYLKKFHAKYYHPSNSRIFSYGNFSLEHNLSFVNSYLRNYSFLSPVTTIVKPQDRWLEPRRKEVQCRIDQFGAPIEKQNQIAIGYAMCDITDVYKTFVLTAVSELLTLGPNAAFYKSLIEPNISGGYNNLTGYDNQIRDTLFIVGLKDVEGMYLDKVEATINKTLESVYEEGFDKDHIDSVLHGFELSIKHQSPKFGLNLLFNLMPLWNHDGAIAEALKVNVLMSQLKRDLRDPNYIKHIILQHFINNTHKLVMTVQPDPKFDERFNLLEAELLKRKVNKLNSNDKQQIYQEGLELAEAQNADQNIDVLPCLKTNEIVLNKTAPTLKHTKFGTIPLQLCEGSTNGITYFKGILGTDSLNEEQILVTPFFNYILDKFDTKSFNYRDFDKYISTCSSGIGAITHVSEHIDIPGQYEQGILISSHCLDENLSKMLDIWKEIFDKPNFSNEERLKMLLTNYCSSLTTGVIDNGHTYAMQAARSLVSAVELCKENLMGIHHVTYMQQLQRNVNIDQITNILNLTADNILNGNNLRAAFNYSPNSGGLLREIESFCASLCPVADPKEINSINWLDCQPKPKESQSLIISMNIPVNFCAKAIPTVPYVHPDHAKLRVLSRFLTSKYLHPVVREKNGAYGGGANLNIDGIFNFYSYRDPNTRVTLDVFDASSNWLELNKKLITEQNLFESKLSVLQQMDQPVAEHMKGIDLFVYGLSYDIWKTQRQRVLDVNRDDLIETCIKYLNPENWAGKCVIGETSVQKIKKANEFWEEIVGPQQ